MTTVKRFFLPALLMLCMGSLPEFAYGAVPALEREVKVCGAKNSPDELLSREVRANDRMDLLNEMERNNVLDPSAVVRKDEYDSFHNLIAYTLKIPKENRSIRVSFDLKIAESGPDAGKAIAVTGIHLVVRKGASGKVIGKIDLVNLNASLMTDAGLIAPDQAMKIVFDERYQKAFLCYRDKPGRFSTVHSVLLDLKKSSKVQLQDLNGFPEKTHTLFSGDGSKVFLVTENEDGYYGIGYNVIYTYDATTGALGHLTVDRPYGWVITDVKALGKEGLRICYTGSGPTSPLRYERDFDAQGKMRVERGLDIDGFIKPYERYYRSDGKVERSYRWFDTAHRYLMQFGQLSADGKRFVEIRCMWGDWDFTIADPEQHKTFSVIVWDAEKDRMLNGSTDLTGFTYIADNATRLEDAISLQKAVKMIMGKTAVTLYVTDPLTKKISIFKVDLETGLVTQIR